MRSAILLSVASLSTVCLLASGSGCGSSSAGTSPGTDSGTGNETSSGSSGSSSGSSSGGSSGSSSGGLPQGDASNDTGSDAAQCLVMPAGKQILSSATAFVAGVTSDGQVLYADATALTLSAVPIAGGTSASIGAFNSAQDPLFTVGKAAAYFTGLTQTSAPQYGPITAWTSAGGAKTISTSSYYGNLQNAFDISSDGSLILYTDNATATTADIYVSGTDGSNKYKIAGGVSWGANCAPVLRFIGNDPAVAYCDTQPDASTTPAATVAVISGGPTFQTPIVQTFTTVGFPTVAGTSNTAGSMISFVTAGGLYVEAIGGTTPTLIDANGTSGFFTNAGTSLLYFDKNTNLWTSPVTTPAPAEIAAGPWAGTLALSSDDKWLELFKALDSTGTMSDMYLVSTTPVDGGTPVTTLTNMANGANYYDAFTADNSHAIYFTPIDMNGVAPILSLALPPAGTPATVSMTGWIEFGTSGTKMVYADNWAMGGSSGYVDIKGVDVAMTTAPTTLVSGADGNFQLTADKKTVVYSWNYCPGQVTGGIYTIAAP
jgi:hypothetical protein